MRGDVEAQRAILQREMDEAMAKLGPPADARSRRKRAKQLKKAVVDPNRLRSGDRSETTISFRGSASLKGRLQALNKEMRASGREKLNEWMERVIEAALEAEGRAHAGNGHDTTETHGEGSIGTP